MNKEKNKTHWKRLKSDAGPDLILFKTRYDYLENPRNSHQLKAVVLEAPDWVNVVALTPDKKIVLVRQYRFGISKETIEIPAGLIDPGENSREAALRELREETGYTSRNWHYLGYVEPNPAFLNNLCHTWLAADCKQTEQTELDRGENIEVLVVSEQEMHQFIRSGEMRNSLAIVALANVFDVQNLMRRP